MVDGTIGIDEPGTIDLNLDTEDMGGTPPKHRERVQITGAVLAEIARVLNADPALTDYGLFVRNRPHGVVSPNETGNSSIVALGIGATFTGTGEEAKDYASITVLVFSDEASATDGLSAEYSSNNVDWDDNDKYTISASTAKALTFFPEGRYFRIVYTNGGTAQTVFRLQTIYRYHRTKPSSHRIGDLAPADINENDAELVYAVSVGNEQNDNVDSGSPVKVGGRASATVPTAVASGDRVNAYLDVNGRLVITQDLALPAGTNNIGDVDIVSFSAGAIVEVQGDVAHDAPAAGNPVLTGARANLNEPAVVGDGDATYLWADQLGRLVVVGGHPNPEPPVSVNAVATGETTIIAAPGAGVSLYIAKGSVHNRDVEGVIALKEGAAGTIRWRAGVAADGGGSLFDFGDRGWKLPANTALVADLTTTANGDINVSDYYIAP